MAFEKMEEDELKKKRAHENLKNRLCISQN